MAHQHHVHPCRHGGYHALHRAVVFLDGIHLHAVAHHQPREAQPIFQHPGDDPPGHGAGHIVRLQLREQDVAAHDSRNPCLHGRPEGLQLQSLQLLHGLVDHRETYVGIHRRVPMAREMLGAGEDPALAVSPESGSSVCRHGLRGIAVAAHPDHRVLRIVVDVHAGGQVEVHAHGLQLLCRDMGQDFRVLHISRSRRGHGPRHVAAVPGEPGHLAALLVDGDEGVMPRLPPHQLLNVRAQGLHLLHALQVALEQDDVPYLVLLHQALKFRIQLRPRESYHQPLSNLFSQIHVAPPTQMPQRAGHFVSKSFPPAYSAEPVPAHIVYRFFAYFITFCHYAAKGRLIP